MRLTIRNIRRAKLILLTYQNLHFNFSVGDILKYRFFNLIED